MSQDRIRAVYRAYEWPTWLVIIAVYGGWFLLTFHASSMSWWQLMPLGAILICWHMHIQHEILHGHPTKWTFVNSLLGWPPLSLWIPYSIYRESHIRHHAADQLTSPGQDPESFYVDASEWCRYPRWKKRLYIFNQSLLGRFLVGPFLAMGGLLTQEGRMLLQGDFRHLPAWGFHGALVAIIAWYLENVCQLPFWQYILTFALPGTSLALLRSFLEHRPAAEPGHRTAIVEGGFFTRFLFLNNNLHVVHHDHPGLPWYRIPAFYRANREAILMHNGGYFYRSYSEVFRRHFWKAKDIPKYPFARI
ncbi:fatty acid desaturase [Aestuariispira insulae]|uniref:Fatty acid desaturase n=1 Tax=Aestuariispira insulae TaxID=1461337 RepID=A0A3D9HNW8_9PROT|nr:fatty acid desaturase [Aestuariispira insulae]RED51001.1 fatty acid desaturase [Aestuariispira insulae]